MNSHAITISDLTKTYNIPERSAGLKGAFCDLFSTKTRDINAVVNVTTNITKGDIVGLMGRNGAGKSTLIKMMTGVLKPSSGSLAINNVIPSQNNKNFLFHIGIVFGQRSQLWWDLPIIESFQALKHIYKIPQHIFDENLAIFNSILEIDLLLKTPARNLSLGQRILCDVLAAFLHRPSVVLLDEPTIGLDAVIKEKIRKIILDLNKEFNTTVLISSHDLDDIETLCDRLLVLDKGKMIFDDNIMQFYQQYGAQKNLVLTSAQPISNRENLQHKFNQKFGHTINLTVNNNTGKIEVLFNPKNIKPIDIIQHLNAEVDVEDISIFDPPFETTLKRMYAGQ